MVCIGRRRASLGHDRGAGEVLHQRSVGGALLGESEVASARWEMCDAE